MDIETKIKNFIDYAREVCLQSLLLADNIKVDLKNQDNLYEVERIDKEEKKFITSNIPLKIFFFT